MSQSKAEGQPVSEDFVPFMGFQEEKYIPGHHDHREFGTSWAAFYTCIANGKRVYVWSWWGGTNNDGRTCCVMLSDNEYDPQRGAEEAELQNMFAQQHSRQKQSKTKRTHQVPRDPFVVQVFIHNLTLGGNNV